MGQKIADYQVELGFKNESNKCIKKNFIRGSGYMAAERELKRKADLEWKEKNGFMYFEKFIPWD